MNKKHIRYALCLVLLTGLLGGCGSKPGGAEQPSQTSPTLNSGPLISITTTAPTEATTEVTTPTVETTPPASVEPVQRLSCIQWNTVPQFLNLGDGAVLACHNDYEEGKGVVNLLDIIDVREDRVLAQEKTPAPRELVDQQFEDAHFILREPETNSFYVYDRNLQVVTQFRTINTNGYFSYDRKNYYFIDNEVLYRMDIATGNYARMSLEYDLRLESLIGIHPNRDILVGRCYRSFYNDTTAVFAIDCKTGKFLLLNDTVSHLWFDGDSFYGAATNDKVYGNDILCGTLSGGVDQKVTASALGSDTVSYTMLSGSGIMMLRTVDEKNLSTTVYDLSQVGISSKLAQHGYSTSTLAPIYLAKEQWIFGVYPDDHDFSPVVIVPKSLSYEKSLNVNKASWPALVDRALILNYQAEVTGPELPNNLQTLRLKADGLEQTYGVSILMGNQTLGLCNSYAAVNTDPIAISNALTALEQALSQYPGGFFAQFQNGIGEGGLYFCLTDRIQGSLEPVGKAIKNRNRYEIALDITSSDLNKTIHHELWHTIEMKLSTDSFNHPRWQAANPQGFLYYGHYDSGYQHLTQWTFAQSGEQCHFVDAYAQINPQEDRARLMEYVMTTDASALLRSGALHEKLEMMSNAIRDHFNTDLWQTPLWERYL